MIFDLWLGEMNNIYEKIYAKIYEKNLLTFFHEFLYEYKIRYPLEYLHLLYDSEIEKRKIQLHDFKMRTHFMGYKMFWSRNPVYLYISEDKTQICKYFECTTCPYYIMSDFLYEAFFCYVLHLFEPNHIPQLYEFGLNVHIQNNGVYYIQECMSKRSYFHTFGDISYQMNLTHIQKLCELLEKLQIEYDFIHGDLHCSNICIKEDGTIALIDFEYSMCKINCDHFNLYKNWELYLDFPEDSNESIHKWVLSNDVLMRNPNRSSSDIMYFMIRMLGTLETMEEEGETITTEIQNLKMFILSFFILKQYDGQNINLYEELKRRKNGVETAVFDFFFTKSHRFFYYIMEDYLISAQELNRFISSFHPSYMKKLVKFEMEFQIFTS